MSRYPEAEEALHALACRPIDNTPPKSGRRLRRILDSRGGADAGMQIAIVAGTVGKGSTSACLASILRACGERVGLFTGPHLVRYTERVEVDGTPIHEDEWARRVFDLLPVAEAMEDRPSLVELLAVLALEWFAEQGVRWAVMEAGVGGTRDYTFGLHPEVSVLTRIDLDHMHLLGGTIPSVAEEKCGVIRPGESAVSALQPDEARDVIVRRAHDAGAPLWIAGRDFTISSVAADGVGTTFDYACPPLDVGWSALQVALLGAHQAENAATAVTAALRIWVHGRVLLSEEGVRRGLAEVRMPGRMERIAGPPDVLLDGAHQPAGARALRAALDAVFAGRPVFLVLGVLGDKDREGVASALIPRAARVWLTMPPWAERAGEAESLEAWARSWRERAGRAGPVASKDWREALEAARASAAAVEDGLVVVSGSLYLVGAVRRELRPALSWP